MKYKNQKLLRLNKFTRRLFGYDRWVVKYINHEYILYSMRKVNRRQNEDAKISLRKSHNTCMESIKSYSMGGDVDKVIAKWTELLEKEKIKIKKHPEYYNKKSNSKILSEIIMCI